MDSPNLVTRIVAPLLPLIVIAVIFGAAGYALTEPSTRPIPPLPAAGSAPGGTLGELQDVSGDRLTLTTDAGETLNYTMAPDATVEVLRPIGLDDVQAGDWINGGAIPHPQTILALVRLILIPDPVLTP